jgi:hypothetical protein
VLRPFSLSFFFSRKRGGNRAAHGGLWSALASPDFILCEALREKHFHSGNGLDSLSARAFQ